MGKVMKAFEAFSHIVDFPGSIIEEVDDGAQWCVKSRHLSTGEEAEVLYIRTIEDEGGHYENWRPAGYCMDYFMNRPEDEFQMVVDTNPDRNNGMFVQVESVDDKLEAFSRDCQNVADRLAEIIEYHRGR